MELGQSLPGPKETANPDALRAFLNQLSVAMLRSQSIGGANSREDDKLAKHTAQELRAIIAAVQRRSQDTAMDPSPVATPLAFSFRNLTKLLTEGYRERVKNGFGSAKIELLRSLLAHGIPDILDVLGKSADENSHSDILRWLLDPAEARTIAPAALHALVSRLKAAAEWQSRITAAIQHRALSVRREYAFCLDGADENSQGRFDLLISGPSLKLVIENKVNAEEHENQTNLYWEWLIRQPGLKAGMILSPIGVPAQNPEFEAISYIDVLNCLLEGPIKTPMELAEEAVLASFVKALASGVLRQEFTIIMGRR